MGFSKPILNHFPSCLSPTSSSHVEHVTSCCQTCIYAWVQSNLPWIHNYQAVIISVPHYDLSFLLRLLKIGSSAEAQQATDSITTTTATAVITVTVTDYYLDCLDFFIPWSYIYK